MALTRSPGIAAHRVVAPRCTGYCSGRQGVAAASGSSWRPADPFDGTGPYRQFTYCHGRESQSRDQLGGL